MRSRASSEPPELPCCRMPRRCARSSSMRWSARFARSVRAWTYPPRASTPSSASRGSSAGSTACIRLPEEAPRASGVEQERIEALAVAAAEREARAAPQDQLVIAVKQRMHLGDVLDVDEYRTVYAYETCGIEALLELSERLTKRLAA